MNLTIYAITWPGRRSHRHPIENLAPNAPKVNQRTSQAILPVYLLHRETHHSLKSSNTVTSQLDGMDVFRALGFSEAVALPAICAVLNRMAKQDGKFLPRWSQLLRGVFLSQIILLPVIGILYVHESAFWILVAAAGSWFVSIRILDQFSFGMHESSRHPDFNEGSQHAPRNSHSQPTVVVNQVRIHLLLLRLSQATLPRIALIIT